MSARRSQASQALLITKHMCFIGFSLTDDAFNQIAPRCGEHYSRLLPGGTIATSRTSSASSAATSFSPPSAASPSSSSSSSSTSSWTRLKTFGSALTRPIDRHGRALPELEAVPMGEGPRGRCDRARQRRLEVLLDHLLLTTDTSSTSSTRRLRGLHLADLELKTEIRRGRCAACGSLLARRSVREIRNMLTKLGLPEDITTIDQLVNVIGQQRW